MSKNNFTITVDGYPVGDNGNLNAYPKLKNGNFARIRPLKQTDTMRKKYYHNDVLNFGTLTEQQLAGTSKAYEAINMNLEIYSPQLLKDTINNGLLVDPHPVLFIKAIEKSFFGGIKCLRLLVDLKQLQKDQIYFYYMSYLVELARIMGKDDGDIIFHYKQMKNNSLEEIHKEFEEIRNSLFRVPKKNK